MLKHLPKKLMLKSEKYFVCLRQSGLKKAKNVHSLSPPSGVPRRIGARPGELILGAYNTLTYIAMDIFTIVPIFIGLVFVIVVGTILFRVGKGLAEWANNNSMPVQSEHVRIVAKRSETSGHSEGPVSTRYYVTFELLSGDRRELSIHGKEYGMLSEGDEGTLTYQGTRYHGFDRDRG